MARILSIEDDSDIQHVIGQSLFRNGYDVHYAWNGQEGYEKILALDPDLILLDLMLPLMNGVELLNKLQMHKPAQNIPVVVVTGYGDEANMLGYSVKALGAAAYLRKPINLVELVSVVKRTFVQYPPESRRDRSPEHKVMRKGAVQIDVKFNTVWINDRLSATLSQKEFVLLCCLMESSGPVARADLIRRLSYEPNQTDALKQAIHRLRECLGPTESHRIKTTPEGYELIG
jgi:two-component system alkaline phosphatase synthesis response regulator PhoP